MHRYFARFISWRTEYDFVFEQIRCSAYIYSIYFRSHERVAEEERARTTIGPLPETREAIVFPIHRISDNNGSENVGAWCGPEYRVAGITLILTFVVR
ncbi:unnamed protein product [Leptosia nina]|uniref:Uncharacterized protein n=1 Tax=Leptosia nina TaxID=320188 RepID=A0AAV1JMM4_9NEOP